jgi:hypothetical protein
MNKITFNNTQNDLLNILNSNNPGKDLHFYKGKICNKNIFYRFFYAIGILKEDTTGFKNRINDITQRLLGENPQKFNFYVSKSKLLELVRPTRAQGNNDLIVGVLLNKISNIYSSLNDYTQMTEINKYKRQNLKSLANTEIGYLHSHSKKIQIKSILQNENNHDEREKLKSELLQHKMETKIFKAQFLYKLGEVGESEKGTTGTSLVFDYRKDGTKRLLGVFKPDGEYSPTSVRINTYFKKQWGQLSHLSNKPLAQPIAERVAYEASLFFGLDSVPPSKLVEMNQIKGVFQLAVQTVVKTRENEQQSTKNIKLQEAKDFMTPSNNILNDPNREFKTSEVEAFQRFALLDFLIGNLDAHEENWFVKFDEERNEITHIIGIDKANSFPSKNPQNRSGPGKNQYKWRDTPIAAKPFTEQMKILMGTLSEEMVDTFIQRVNMKFDGFFNEQMIKLLHTRVKAMREIINIDDANPALLAEMTN